MGYTLAELALMTGYSSRSLRSFYRQGLLTGTMMAGKYSFSEEDVKRFVAQPFIEIGLRTKSRMQVQHFLEEDHAKDSATCLIHDEPDRERAERLNRILLEYINQRSLQGFSYTYLFDDKKEVGRFIFTGQAKDMIDVLERVGKSQGISN